MAHFYPATPEQLINACYEAGFRAVTRGVIGDELVAAEYLKLWEEEPWGTLIRSTDPVVVETVRAQYPELLPYLAPVTCRRWPRPDICGRSTGRAQDRVRGHVPAGQQPRSRRGHHVRRSRPALPHPRGERAGAGDATSSGCPEERRRHLSAAGGHAAGAAGGVAASRAGGSGRSAGWTRSRRWRGRWRWTGWTWASWTSCRTEGALDHPLSGPQEELYWRRELLASTEPPRSRQPVVDGAVVASVGRHLRHQAAAGACPIRRRWRRSWSRSAGGPTGGRGIAGPAASTPASGSPRRRRWGGPPCGSARRTRSAGRTRRSGRRRWTR